MSQQPLDRYTLERCIEAVKAEQLPNPIPGTSNDAYAGAIRDCIRALEALTPVPAPKPDARTR